MLEHDFELKGDERELNGFWIDVGSRVEKDAGWVRIEWLIAERFEQLAERDGEVLYRHRGDGRLWARTGPAPWLPEGGPPRLVRLTAAEAQARFGVEL